MLPPESQALQPHREPQLAQIEDFAPGWIDEIKKHLLKNLIG